MEVSESCTLSTLNSLLSKISLNRAFDDKLLPVSFKFNPGNSSYLCSIRFNGITLKTQNEIRQIV